MFSTLGRARQWSGSATEEGILRKHALTQGGRYRDTIYFSILDTEWPAVRERLQSFLAGA